jgi:hypothetical protein
MRARWHAFCQIKFENRISDPLNINRVSVIEASQN